MISTSLLFLALLVPTTFPLPRIQLAEARLETPYAVSELVRMSREDSRVAATLRELTDLHPRRLTASKGLARAFDWAAGEFRELGLEPRFEAWGTFPAGFERGPWWGRVVYPDARPLEFITHSWTRGTDGPRRGMAVLEPEGELLPETLAELVAGKWVVLRGEGRSGKQRRAFLTACDESGAFGVISRGPESGLLVTGGSESVDPEDLDRACRITLLHDQHVALEAQLASGAKTQLEFDIDNQFTPGPVTNHNLVCDLLGAEFPDEYVIVQAHLDGWDGAEGAQDNGTGVATTLEVARLLVALGTPPRRTIRFVLYSGEEQGLFGSAGYVRDHANELERTSIVLNHDQGSNYLRGITATEAMFPTFEAVFAPVMELDPERPFAIELVDGITGGASDHAPFVQAGVPAFHWKQEWSGYTYVHHTQHDTFAEVRMDDVRHSVAVIALAAHGFAELDDLVSRREMRAPEPRRMGVFLSGTEVTGVSPDSRAAAAGWQKGDVILSIDGTEVASRRELTRRLQEGGPEKRVVVQRGEERLETLLDYSDDPEEDRRQARLARLEALRAEREAAADPESGQ
ncbi:MAG: M20/M25/M40 family metallo-hydrolase [Planctomycetes bacterium]|nr:M20/M25/M40 family metallo-hydrolase [Planctomycetota bacterium]MCB9906042.1 M20/M25/M40 family metallo-hydrolase [Planctomycetota bacterium]